METRRCAFGPCEAEFQTTDQRKLYCTKRHADRGRNLRVPLVEPSLTIRELKDFRKLDEAGKQRVLLGEAGFSVVMFDIEATHLKANVGRELCVSFKPIGQPVYTFQALDRRFRRRDNYDDSALVAATRDELEKFDIIVGWNSKNFDIKFINARNLRANQRTKRAQYHVDGMWSWRSKAAAWSGLDAVQKFALPSGTAKSPVVWEQWMRAIGWSKALREAAMADIVEHCERDVEVLEEVYRLVVRNNVVRSLRKDGGVL